MINQNNKSVIFIEFNFELDTSFFLIKFEKEIKDTKHKGNFNNRKEIYIFEIIKSNKFLINMNLK